MSMNSLKIKVAILKNEREESHIRWMNSCINLNIPYEIIEFISKTSGFIEGQSRMTIKSLNAISRNLKIGCS